MSEYNAGLTKNKNPPLWKFTIMTDKFNFLNRYLHEIFFFHSKISFIHSK